MAPRSDTDLLSQQAAQMKLMAARERLDGSLRGLNAANPDRETRVQLERGLQAITKNDKTGLRQANAGINGRRPIQSSPTEWLMKNADNLSVAQLEARANTVMEMSASTMRVTIELQRNNVLAGRDLNSPAPKLGLVDAKAAQVAPGQPVRSANRDEQAIGDATRYDVDPQKLDEQARKLLDSKEGRKPDGIVARYKKLLDKSIADAKGAQFAANQMLSKPGEVGLSSQIRDDANRVLAGMNRIGGVSAGSISTARVSGANSMPNNQAILVRAVKLELTDAGVDFNKVNSKMQGDTFEHARNTEQYASTVKAMDDMAIDYANNANSKAMEPRAREVADNGPGLNRELARGIAVST